MKSTTPRCKLCKKPLTNPESITKGIGPECAAKWAWTLCNAGLTLEALQIPESVSTDKMVARHLHMAEQALLIGRRRDMEAFKKAAQEAAQRAALALAA